MAGITKSTILLLFSLICVACTLVSASTPTKRGTGPTDFIKSSCTTTRYPALCIRSLSAYATSVKRSPKQLAQAALSVSLARARSAKDFVSKQRYSKGIKSRDLQAMKDCVENMSDSVDRLSKSMKEMSGMGRAGYDFRWHMSNVQTWVSSALTDENTCVDGFAGSFMNPNLRAAVKGRVVNVAQVTSNALALVNRYAERQMKKKTP